MGWEAIGALATAGAALVALVVYLGAVSQAKRRQAEQVSAWLELVRDDREGTFEAVVRNGSDQPIYAAYARESHHGPIRSGEWIFTQDPLPPGATARELTDIPGTDAYQPLDIIFRDAAGRHWARTDGRLRRRRVRKGRRSATRGRHPRVSSVVASVSAWCREMLRGARRRGR